MLGGQLIYASSEGVHVFIVECRVNVAPRCVLSAERVAIKEGEEHYAVLLCRVKFARNDCKSLTKRSLLSH